MKSLFPINVSIAENLRNTWLTGENHTKNKEIISNGRWILGIYRPFFINSHRQKYGMI